MSDFTFKLNRSGIAEMAVGPEVSAAVRAVAEKGKAIAEGLSTDFTVSGDYIGSFEVDVEIKELPAAGSSPSHPAAVGILRNNSGHAVAVEYGYEGRSGKLTKRAHRVFGRTLAALGA